MTRKASERVCLGPPNGIVPSRDLGLALARNGAAPSPTRSSSEGDCQPSCVRIFRLVYGTTFGWNLPLSHSGDPGLQRWNPPLWRRPKADFRLLDGATRARLEMTGTLGICLTMPRGIRHGRIPQCTQLNSRLSRGSAAVGAMMMMTMMMMKRSDPRGEDRTFGFGLDTGLGRKASPGISPVPQFRTNCPSCLPEDPLPSGR